VSDISEEASGGGQECWCGYRAGGGRVGEVSDEIIGNLKINPEINTNYLTKYLKNYRTTVLHSLPIKILAGAGYGPGGKITGAVLEQVKIGNGAGAVANRKMINLMETYRSVIKSSFRCINIYSFQ